MDIAPLLARVKAILLHPAEAWPRIAAEAQTPAGLYRRHVLLLAALPPVFGFVRESLIGRHTLGMVLRDPVVEGLWRMVLGYLANLLMVYVVALVVQALAPTFEARKDPIQALKLVAHAWTPVWIAGIATIFPGWIGVPVAVAGLAYAVYLFYLGLPHTMHNPRERSLGFAATSAVLAVLLTWILAALLAAVSLDTSRPVGTRGTTPGDRTTADRQAPAADGQTLAPARMRALLPARLDGFRRVSAQARRQQVMGMQLSQATATYQGKGQQRIELKITDTAGAKALLGLTDDASGDAETLTDNGFDTLRHRGDRVLRARWNGSEQRGEYTVLLARRFSVQASGHVKDAGELEKAVHAVDLDALDKLGRAGDRP